ncbi:MAG: ABC transporter permease, partial [Winogradskyella sp.]|uniref:ABC transporter permease n=1 Tax=Winogradskyella sp. TaxID=1883156 RepID=UPI0025E1155B
MSIVYLAYKNLVSKPLNLALSLLLLMLSVSLVTFVFQLRDQLDNQLDRNIAPFDMVVGAKGSPLQLILSSVLHIDAPTGNIKLSDVKLLQKHPFVKAAIPVSYGDNYNGYRILGTKKEYLQRYNVGLSEGKLFEKPFEAVIGYKAARLLGLSIGDTFVGNHGLVASQGHSHDDKPYIVTGILEQSGTVVDQLIVTSLESVWDAHDHGDEHDHDEDHHHEHANEDKEITSLLVKFKSPLGMVQLPRYINENTNAQAALPGFEIQKLMNLLGSGVKTINGIAIAILLVSAFSIFISLLKTIRERR